MAKVVQGEGCTIEYRIRHKDGTYRWIEDNKRVVRDAAGQPTEIVGVWTDVTERKKLEESLRKSEAELRVIFENAAIGMVARRLGRPAAQANRALQQLLGYTEEELRGMAFPEFTHPGRCRGGHGPLPRVAE